jgi:N6-L-threonylcarbamoyladenine synthase
MRILAIETSCDETAVCLIDAQGGYEETPFTAKVLGNALYSQIAVHAEYGGVYPNLAKREHIQNLVPILTQCLADASELGPEAAHQSADTLNALETLLEREVELYNQLKAFLEKYKKPHVDCIAVTHGPGLEPALWVGVNFAKALSLAWNIPIVAVNHMEGHIVISALEFNNDTFTLKPITYPMLALLISGGHTELVLAESTGINSLIPESYQLIGQTRDDAVGEAFDKVARLLKLPYPGGPEISRLAEIARDTHTDATPIEMILPRPMIHDNTYDFSFSGLKTAVRRIVEIKQSFTNIELQQFAREFEDAAADVLIAKTVKAIEEFGVQTVVVGGGVSANTHIRRRLNAALSQSVVLLVPPPALATDNAIMIGMAGYFHALKQQFADPEKLRAQGNLPLT